MIICCLQNPMKWWKQHFAEHSSKDYLFLNEDYPIVQVYDNNKNQMLPASIVSTTANRVVLTFDSAFTGQVSVKK